MTQIILYGNKSIHIDGYKCIVSFTSKQLSVKCRNKTLNIKGCDLKIDSFTSVYMVISGTIDDISWSD
ncbi:MAG: YabP/YqfC family sporulation protein [Lachnospiraceae bacterium]|nr:YabP/YqfC family sporulation protein [Lachnospiraceae bacterium]